MKNIDEFMRDKFEGDDPAGRFEFRAEYWEQALALLESQGKRGKKRGWLWWLGIGGLLLLGAGLVWSVNFTAMKHHAPTGKAREEGMHPSAGKPSGPSVAKDTPLDTLESRKIAALSGKALQEKTGAIDPAAAPDPVARGEKTIVTTSPVRVPDDHSDANPPTGGRLVSQDDTLNLQIKADSLADRSIHRSAETIEYLKTLLSPVRPLQTPKESRPAQAVPVGSTHIAVFRKSLRWDLEAGAALYPGLPLTGFLGANAGLSALYRFRPHWAVSFGMGMALMPEKSAGSNTADYKPQTFDKYSFGFTEDIFYTRSTALLTIEFPVKAHWLQRNFGLEAGLLPTLNTGAILEYVHETSNSLAPDPVSRSGRRLKFSNPVNVRNLGLSVTAGGHFDLSRRLEVLGLAGCQVLGSLQPTPALSVDQAQAVRNLWWVETGIRISF